MKKLLTSLAIASLALATSNLAAETTIAPAKTLDELYKNTVQAKNKASAENQRRLNEFRKDLANQKRLLADARVKLQQEEDRSERLKAQFQQNEEAIAELEKEKTLKMGNMGEMVGVVRQVAADTKAHVANSIVSSQYPDRQTFLDNLQRSKELPRIKDLRELWSHMLKEMTESGKVVKFDADVTTREGSSVNKQVTRIGAFNLVADGEYLYYDVESNTIKELLRQPDSAYLSMIEEYQNSSTVEPVALDPSRGNLLSLIVEKPSIEERFHQGEQVGYAITVVGIFGLILALVRFFMLMGAEVKMRGQMKSSTPGKNPLGRVMAVYLANKDVDVENLELKLDEAVLKETPKIEFGVTFIKVLSAIAPLMGLLGTVIGMIKTFQNITLFGTGDVKLMAGGISTALMTTVMGIIAAIPLILAHALVAGKSKKLIHILEQQSAGYIAAHAEKEEAR